MNPRKNSKNPSSSASANHSLIKPSSSSSQSATHGNMRPAFTQSPAHFRQQYAGRGNPHPSTNSSVKSNNIMCNTSSQGLSGINYPIKAQHLHQTSGAPYRQSYYQDRGRQSGYQKQPQNRMHKQYGYPSDRPQYPSSTKNNPPQHYSILNYYPTLTSKQQQRRSQQHTPINQADSYGRYQYDPQSTRSFDAIADLDDLGTVSDRELAGRYGAYGGKGLGSLNDQMQRRSIQNDAEFENTLVSLQGRMKNLQNKYLQMANYYRDELKKGKYRHDHNNGAQLLQKLQEQNDQADQELKSVFDAKSNFLSDKLIALTKQVEKYQKQNYDLKTQIKSLINNNNNNTSTRKTLSRPQSSAKLQQRSSNKIMSPARLITPKQSNNSRRDAQHSSIPRATPPNNQKSGTKINDFASINATNKYKSSSIIHELQEQSRFPVRITGQRLLARVQDLTRNLQDDVVIQQERRSSSQMDLKKIFRKHGEKLKDAITSTFDSLSSAYDNSSFSRNNSAQNQQPPTVLIPHTSTGPQIQQYNSNSSSQISASNDFQRQINEFKSQLDINTSRISKILSTLKHKISLSKLDLDKVDLQLADINGFLADKLSSSGRYDDRVKHSYIPDMSMIKQKMKLLQANCQIVAHRSQLSEKEIDIAQNLNDDGQIM